MIPKQILNKKFRGIMVLAVSQETFKEEVLNASTPVLVNFWAPWCGLCRLINPMLIKCQSECGTEVKLVSINADENLKLANAYRLTTLPTVIVFAGGKVLHRLDKFRSRDDLRVAAADLQMTLDAITSYSYTA
jgi:thioredoxin 1